MLKQHVLPTIGSARVDEIAPSDIAQLIGSKSGKYALNLYALLNVMFSVACDLDSSTRVRFARVSIDLALGRSASRQ